MLPCIWRQIRAKLQHLHPSSLFPDTGFIAGEPLTADSAAGFWAHISCINITGVCYGFGHPQPSRGETECEWGVSGAWARGSWAGREWGVSGAWAEHEQGRGGQVLTHCLCPTNLALFSAYWISTGIHLGNLASYPWSLSRFLCFNVMPLFLELSTMSFSKSSCMKQWSQLKWMVRCSTEVNKIWLSSKPHLNLESHFLIC